MKQDDRGSALPIFIFGAALLMALTAVLLGSAQLIQQQRRVNGASDSVALTAAASGLANPMASGNGSLMRFAQKEFDQLYGDAPQLAGGWVAVADSETDGKVRVTVCAKRQTIWAPAAPATICATSRAGIAE